MVKIDVVYEGGLRTRAVHGPSGQALSTDAPKDNEGRGESFSPTDLLATSLGACMLTIMGIVAKRRGIAMEGASAEVEKHMVTDPVRRVGKLSVVITLPNTVQEGDFEVLRRAALSCPVHQSLHPSIEIPFLLRAAGATS
jgi:putative redox protein